MFQKIRTAITDDNEIPKEWQRFASLALLLFAFVLAMFPYEVVGWRRWLPGKHELNFRPSFQSGAIALALITPLYLRGLLKWNKSPFTTISFILILGVFASFVEMSLLGGKSKSGSANLYTFMLALALSWAGIRGIAGIAWIIVMVLGVYNVHLASLAFGFSGFLYICSAFMGLCFHSGVNPGELVRSLKEEYSPSIAQSKRQLTENFAAASKITRP